jgi:Zn-dependent protease
MSPDLFILRIPAILIALTIHEFCHGYVAYRLGDSTAHDAGRLTLNPFAHLDVFGTIMLLLGPFGWAKPVPVNGYNLKNPKRDLLLVSLAGPASNVVTALIFGFALRIIAEVVPTLANNSNFINFFNLVIMLNIGISFFNLIPIPPLDGSKIIAGLLPNEMIPGYFEKMKYLPTVFMVMLLAEWGLHIPVFSTIMNPLYKPYAAAIYFLIGLGS